MASWPFCLSPPCVFAKKLVNTVREGITLEWPWSWLWRISWSITMWSLSIKMLHVHGSGARLWLHVETPGWYLSVVTRHWHESFLVFFAWVRAARGAIFMLLAKALYQKQASSLDHILVSYLFWNVGVVSILTKPSWGERPLCAKALVRIAMCSWWQFWRKWNNML